MRAAVSLVIVSQKRPQELARVLASLQYQSLQNFEIIVVADAMITPPAQVSQKYKFLSFNETNISKARNMGILAARAPIVAFCDDDAIPDPKWLERLIRPFYKNDIGASTGFVRGTNGISYQWGAIKFDRQGKDHNLKIPPLSKTQIIAPHRDKFVKTIGTNCAFRRDALHKVGGFDEAYFYYLDDTDLNIRLQKAGFATAIVPRAEVIHSYFESRGRSSNRVPKTLYNLGASMHHFLLQHYDGDIPLALEDFENRQRRRLEKFFHFGLLRGKQINALMRDLRRGIAAGASRNTTTPLQPIRKPKLADVTLKTIELTYTRSRTHEVPLRIMLTHSTRSAKFRFRDDHIWELVTGRFGRFHRNEKWMSYRRPRAGVQRAKDFIESRFLG